MTPKLKFQIPKVEDYLDSLEYFILNNPIWKEKIFSVYPALEDRLNNSDDLSKELKEFFLKKETKFSKVLEKVKKDFQESWNKINDSIFKKLEEINELEFSNEDFIARVTLNPICPRYLDKNTFDLYFGMAERTMRTICLHELSHFIFFKKFKSIYLEIGKEEFESPHLVWKLSEMIPGVIFDSGELDQIFEVQEEVLVYESIQKLEINGKRILKILKEFYDSSKDFEDFIRKSYQFLKEHEKEIKI